VLSINSISGFCLQAERLSTADEFGHISLIYILHRIHAFGYKTVMLTRLNMSDGALIDSAKTGRPFPTNIPPKKDH